MKKIYFLCTGNSCRSQIAEGYGHQFLEGWEVRSAGVETHGLNPRAVEVMAEDGVDISNQKSELIDIDYFNSCDLIITLCGDALDKCPMIPNEVNHEHWDLQDPARVSGSDDQILEAFRNTRDLIKVQVEKLTKL
ncbi:arsenate reductase (thioredoxin) [Lactococcus taiwanensis]|uniref:arsenate reductase (thioredoxin) n=1 Tax=Lactococcus taiwanensis TaxID=1151742 RepID=UPI0019065877|nr:arsenate reductase (thioredoxin) [Lactococcus taiwanensis]